MEDTDDFAEEYGFIVRPYMFEPDRHVQEPASSDDSSDSEEEEEGNVDFPGQERVGTLHWCECSNCCMMPTARESKCCREFPDLEEKLDVFTCITQHPGFIANCRNRDVIEVSFYEFLQVNGPIGDEEPIHEVYRYVAYRRLARWIRHRLAKYDRRVLPACAVNAIRETFPSEQYTGFKYVHDL